MRIIRGLLAVALGAMTLTIGGVAIVSADTSRPERAVLTSSADVQPLTPTRILDTRNGNGVAQAGRVGPAASIDLDVVGRGGVPSAGVHAVVLNVTVARQTIRTFVTVWPTGDPLPLASSLNADPGRPVSNLVVAKVGNGGAVSLHNGAGDVHLIADVVGWVPTGSEVVSTTPSRILDSRTGVGLPAAGRIGPASEVHLVARGAGAVPANGVDAVIVNITAVNPTQRSFITAFPRGEARPLAASVNAAAAKNVSTLAVVKLGSGGALTLYNDSGTTHLIVDVIGYTTTSARMTALTPSRILDTRSGVGAVPGAVGAGRTIFVDVTGSGGVPANGVAAVWLNLGATASTIGSFVTSWPRGETRPVAAALNTDPTNPISNLVLVPVGVDGEIALYNDVGTTHLIADVVGYVPSGTQSPFTVTQRHVNADAESSTRYVREEYDESADDAGDPDGGDTQVITEGYSESIHRLSGTIEDGDSTQDRDTTDPDLRDGPPWVPVGGFAPGSDSVIADARSSVTGAQADAAAEASVDVTETSSQLRLDIRADVAATLTASPDTFEEFPNGDELEETYDARGRARGVAVVWFDVPDTATISLSSDCYGPAPTGVYVVLTRRVGQLTTSIWSSRTCESLSTLEPGAYRIEVRAGTEVVDQQGTPSAAWSATASLAISVL